MAVLSAQRSHELNIVWSSLSSKFEFTIETVNHNSKIDQHSYSYGITNQDDYKHGYNQIISDIYSTNTDNWRSQWKGDNESDHHANVFDDKKKYSNQANDHYSCMVDDSPNQ